VPELAGVEGSAVHEPWTLRGRDRTAAADYPDPVVDLSEGLARFRREREDGRSRGM
jgi:deoxyribodipyrimidine photo-lyase